jgi:hypothetical protein
MVYEEYYTACMSRVPQAVISDEQFSKNKELIENIIYEYYRIDSSFDEYEPEQAAENLIIFFSAISNFGYR